MKSSAGSIFKELELGQWKSLYLLIGQEYFQQSEILTKLTQFFAKNETQRHFNCHDFDGQQFALDEFLNALQTLPGLFDTEESIRLVTCRNAERLSPSHWERILPYFDDPSPTTCVVFVCGKADKRKGWVKAVSSKAAVVELNEPFERDWPKWHGYFQKKIGKQIDLRVWDRLVEDSDRKLALVWNQLQVLATFVGEKGTIGVTEVDLFAKAPAGQDIFAFAEKVVMGQRFESVENYLHLLKNEENEVKILSVLLRQYRLIGQCLDLLEQGITDSKYIASQIGVHPFFVSKIIGQAKKNTKRSVRAAIERLAECDYRLKTGTGNLFNDFLISP